MQTGIEGATLITGLGELAGLHKAGMVVRAGRVPKGNNSEGLVHMAPIDSAQKIKESGTLGLPSDIYAGPMSNANLNNFQLTLKTGLDPHLEYAPIPIPKAAESAFSKPTPIGPFTLWQNLSGTQYTVRGTIDLSTGAFTRTGVNYSQLQWQATDIAVGAGIIGGGYVLLNEEN